MSDPEPRKTHDDLWRAEGEARGWKLPEPAGRFWRIWGVRYVRFLWRSIDVAQWNAMWGSLGYVNTGYDDWVLYAVRRGWV